MPHNWPPHVQWIATHRGEELAAVLGSQGVRLDIEAALAVVVDADPSPGQHAVQWLCDTLLRNGMRWEDVAGGAQSKAGETLQWFSQHRQALGRPGRNLEDYTTLGSLYRALQPLLEGQPVEGDLEPQGRALRRQQRMQAYEETIMVCNRDDLVVAVPVTVASAQWWGRGTRWCTAAEQDNMFDEYNQNAPLLVIVLREPSKKPTYIGAKPPAQGAVKLQLHIDPEDGGYQFMDDADDEVDPWFVHDNWDVLAPLVMWALAQSPTMLKYVPPQLCTQSMYRDAVARDGDLLGNVPWNMRDADMYVSAVKACPRSLKLVPFEFIDEKMCQQAVYCNSGILDYVPRVYQTECVYIAALRWSADFLGEIENPGIELCLRAIERYPEAIKHVPAHVLTRDMCTLAVARDGMTLEHVPLDWRDKPMCTIAIEQEGEAIQYVPHAMQTREMALKVANSRGVLAHVSAGLLDHDTLLEMVRINPRCMLDMSADQITPELCTLAVHANTGMLSFLCSYHPYFITPGLCTTAVQAFAMALGSVPRDMRTPELCAMAVASMSAALTYVPPAMRTPELYAMAIQGMARKNDSALNHTHGHYIRVCLLDSLPDEVKTAEICAACIEMDPGNIAHVPAHMRTYQMCAQIMTANPRFVDTVLCHAPDNLDLPGLHKLAIDLDPLNLRYVDKELRTPELCWRAVEAKSSALALVPEALRTLPMCTMAVRNNNDSIHAIPSHLRRQVALECNLEDIQAAWKPDILDSLVNVLAANPVQQVTPALPDGLAHRG